VTFKKTDAFVIAIVPGVGIEHRDLVVNILAYGRAVNAWVCGYSLAGFVGLNPAVDFEVSLLLVLCVVR
jgi:hypothetical protein